MDAGADALGGGDAQLQEAVEPAGRRLRRRSGDFEAFEAFGEAFQAFPDAIEAFSGARRRVGVGVDAGSHRPTGNWSPALSDLVWGAFLFVGAFPPFPPLPPLLREGRGGVWGDGLWGRDGVRGGRARPAPPRFSGRFERFGRRPHEGPGVGRAVRGRPRGMGGGVGPARRILGGAERGARARKQSLDPKTQDAADAPSLSGHS